MEYAYEHGGVGFEQFAKVAEKNHAHSTLNPLAHYQKAFSLEEVMGDDMMSYPNTRLMCCPNTDGAAAVVLVSEEKLRTLSKEQQKRAVKVSASVLTTDPWTETAQVQPDVNTLTRNAAVKAYEMSGVDPQDLDLVELHDCFATAELIHYDNLQLCAPGEAGKFIDERGPWRDGKIPVNVSGGLISKGHPIGATGIANVYEVTTHLRGEAGDRQIAGAQVGLTHVIGLGSACAVHVLEKSGVKAEARSDFEDLAVFVVGDERAGFGGTVAPADRDVDITVDGMRARHRLERVRAVEVFVPLGLGDLEAALRVTQRRGCVAEHRVDVRQQPLAALRLERATGVRPVPLRRVSRVDDLARRVVAVRLAVTEQGPHPLVGARPTRGAPARRCRSRRGGVFAGSSASGVPVSSVLLRSESTIGHPFPTISKTLVVPWKSSCTSRNRQIASSGSISQVTREGPSVTPSANV